VHVTEPLEQVVTRFLSGATSQDKEVFNTTLELFSDCAEMVFSLS
jgi:hypothetical protein